MTENAPTDNPKPSGIPADVPFLRTIKSYVLRAGRTTIGQAKA
jgi:tRNA (guanine-N7-)-methyltransferase